jgi:hypothetical protein
MASLVVTGVLFGVYLESPLRAELHQPLPTTPAKVVAKPVECTLLEGAAEGGNESDTTTGFAGQYRFLGTHMNLPSGAAVGVRRRCR